MGEAFATSFASNLVSKLGECLFAPIGRQFGYVLCYKSYVEDLKKGVKDLKYAKERVQCSVDKAFYDGKPIYTDVKDWLESVKKKVEEAENLLRDGETANNACFRGWLPNPVLRHPIGRKVKKMTQVIQELRKKSKFTEVHYENPPIGIVTATTSAAGSTDNGEDVLESRASFAKKVIEAISDDKVCVVGVYGPGGVGKSMLLVDIEKRAKEEKLFDVVVMANVSRNPDLRRIQGEIACALGLTITNEETTRGRADLLCRRLGTEFKKNILIILDNLWKKLELNEVGIPCAYDNKVKGCKLLLTSRNREVLRTDMGSDQAFRLNELEDGEAQRLFERTVGNRVNDLDIKPWVNGVVKNCGGLPLLIVSLAKRLKHGDLIAWRNALTHIDVKGIKSIVELNYNDLEDERIKSLFLVCVLTTGRIPMRCYLAYCMGLGLYKKFSKTIENVRDRLIMDLHILQDSSLLLDNNDMEELRIHDVFVDVAISIASTQRNALVGRRDYGFQEWSKDELRKCTAISLIFLGIDELPKILDCPNLRMLLLSESNPYLKIPESFFESMEKLQVLDLTCLSFTSLPSSIKLLENLNSLCVDYCHLEDVTILGKLKGLQFLSELRELRFLDLTRCTSLKVIEPSVLGSLVNLEELYMEASFDQWEAEDEAPRSNASLVELKNMKKLSTMTISILYPIDLPRDLPFGKLKKHKIQIGDIWHWSVEFEESSTLKLKLDSGSLLLEEWVQKCLQRTQDLHLDGLQSGNDSIHDLCMNGFQELKHLHVQNSPSFHYVLHSTEYVQCITFTRLESLFLKDLNNLEKICCGCLALESFGKLKIVKVDNCGKIKYLFPWSMKRIILQLEEIEINRCGLIQQILAYAETNEDGDEIDDDTKLRSCNLRRLTLQNLPKMTSFCKTTDHVADFFNGQQPMTLQSLEAITIERCQLIQEVFDLEGMKSSGEVEILLQLRELTLSDLPSLGHIWSKNPRRTLKVQNCEILRFLFSSSMVKALRQIKETEIANCKLMEEIIDLQEEELEEAATTDPLEFPLLTSLSIKKLPNLGTFSYGKYGIHCPSLTRLTISGCPKMMTFYSSKGKQRSMTADTGFQQAFGHINSGLSLPVFFNEKVVFPSLEELKLSSMCQLKRIWHNQLLGQSFCKLTSFTVELCENLSSVFPSNSMDRLHSLNKIEVVGCPLLEALFELVSLSSERRQKPLVLFALKRMKLLNLPRLTNILKSECKVTLAFPSMMKVNVRHCHSLPYLFSSATAKTLGKLSALDVSCCNNLRGIIAMEEGKWKTVETFKLRHLSTLKLFDLENLISFCSASCASDGLHPLFDDKLAFPNLEDLHIERVQHKELWNEKVPVESFCHLKVLKVKQCHNLINVIPSFMSKRLLHCMEYLKVESCNLIEGIYTLEGLGVMEREATRSSPWKELTLHDLPNLTYIWKNENLLNLYLHNLTTIRVETCPHLKTFLLYPCCQEMEYIVAREEEKPEEVANIIVIPKLVTLHLNNMPKLRSFCHEKHKSQWPSLNVLIVEDCNAVEMTNGDASCRKVKGSIPTQKPLLLNKKVLFPRLAFPSLMEVNVSRCHSLSYLFSSATAETLDKLVVLDVSCCNNLRGIIAMEEGKGKTVETLKFHQLSTLKLSDLENLISLCSASYANDGLHPLFDDKVEFPDMKLMKNSHMNNVEKIWLDDPTSNAFSKLKTLVVEHCEKLSSIFSSYTMLTRFQTLEKITISNCGSLEVVFHIQEFNFSQAHCTSTFQLRELVLTWLPKMRHVWSGHPQGGLTFGCLQHIEVVKCERLKSLFPSSVAKSMTQLEELLVEDCGVEEIIVEEDRVRMNVGDLFFPQLTSLRLLELPGLRGFYKNSCTSIWPLLKEFYHGTSTSENQPALFSFDKVIPNLKGLTLTREDVMMMMHQHYMFHNLRQLDLGCYHYENVAFPSDFLLHRFPDLEVLSVSCSSLKEIFPEDVFEHERATSYGELIDMETPLKGLKNLKRLELNKLCKLQQVWKDGSLMAEILKQIESLLVSECSSLSIVFPSPTAFQRLTRLEVKGCVGLVHMGTCSVVTSLVHLTLLILRDCGKMEDVVTDDGNGAEEISFPELRLLILDGLPSLESFSPVNYAFRFPSLVQIIVKQCPKMNIFCNGALSTPLLDEVFISEENYEGRWEGDLNTTIQSLSTLNNPH
ncbi:hypothetical protein BT93_K1662 [Corymbia citriodora subsp. variegata]|nr:hypothetical protein BT93_K1662 [Corymbia citriodora subsp. variegata]